MDDDGAFMIEKTLVEALLAVAEDDGTGTEDTGPTFAALVEDAGAALPPEKRERLRKQAEIAQAVAANCRRFSRARAAGDEDEMAALRTELDHLRDEASEIARFLDFSYAAERLAKATRFDEFIALLPAVALDRLYGFGRVHGRARKISRFPLIWAMSNRDRPLERVQAMLAAGARLDLATRLGETVLHELAAMNRKAAIRLPILRLLVFKGADLEARNLHGQTALSTAIERGSVADVGHFLTVGARLSRQDLEQAAHKPEKLHLILDHIADDPDLLRAAAAIGGWLRGEIAEWRQHGVEAAQDGAKGVFHAKITGDLERSLDMIAALPGYEEADGTAKVTWEDEPAAFTAVQTATHLDTYRSALARVDITSYGMRGGERVMRGDHPIYWPIRAKADRLDRLWLMLAAGASVAGAPGNGEALHIFAGERRKEADEQLAMARMLVQAGAALDAEKYDGRTPLACAVAGRGHAESAALLALGANPDVTLEWSGLSGPRFQAPLLFAAASDARIFKLLLDHGADPGARDSRGCGLRDYLADSCDAYAAMLAREEMSGNLQRHVTRDRNAMARSFAHLEAGSG